MKTKNEILEELYATEYVDKYSRQICVNSENIEDAIATVWVIICQLPEERLQAWYAERGIDKVRQVVGGIINRQLKSTKSTYYYTWVKKDCRNITQKWSNDKADDWSGVYEMEI